MDIQSEFLIDMVSNAPFLAFLLWQYRVQRADYKEAQTEMKELREKAKEEEEKIRTRWEGVVSKLDEERKVFIQETNNRLKSTSETLDKVQKQLAYQSASLNDLEEQMKDVRYSTLHLVEVVKTDK